MILSDLELRPMKQNWASLVKDLLSKLGCMEAWISQGVGNFNIFFLNLFKVRVKDIFMQDWHSRLDNSSRVDSMSLYPILNIRIT